MSEEDRDDELPPERERADRSGDDAAQDPPDGERSNPSGERSPTDVGPDPSTAGGHPSDPAGSGDESAGSPGDGAGDESAPLSDLRADVEARREAAADEDFEELFTEVETGDVDEEAVWEAVSAAAETPSVDPGAAVADETAGGDTRDVTVVEKRLCHGCPHFADPPETACTHEGTTIDAEVDVDHFRVVDCPVVAEREDRASDFSAEES